MKARIAARLAKCKQRDLFPYPRTAVRGRGNVKQGFPNTNPVLMLAKEEGARPAKIVGTPIFDEKEETHEVRPDSE
jgi:hypothetical protein